ncbi:N-acetylmuramoyl-L-alanine amidase, partial [Clostridioides difficile]|uniref:N-acetylmuramoyl-L-alanine amidase n=1 Tax=Clostridioides difficile TaxID=1496 RepID=UPI00265CC977
VRGLYWLNHTIAPAILIEVCFVDSKADTDYYVNNKDKVAKLITEGILNKDINM